jgi:hypothetical protein
MAYEIPTAWIGTEELPVHFANAFGAVVGPDAIFLTFGSMTPPGIEGATEAEREAQLQAIGYIPIRPIARIALAPARLDEMIAALQETSNNYKELRKAFDEIHGEEA